MSFLLIIVSWLLWLTVFVRSRWPWITLGTGIVIALLGGDVVLLLIGVFHAVLRLPRRQAWIAAGLGVVVVAGSVVRTVVL
ncbi:MAG TPA: two-component sensor histidine kinase, partial [Brevibacterium senegalense]|nr:two-component sensor histidine kinase [Brevibacterium senegalense]